MFYYLIDLHYSQTIAHRFRQLYQVLLPYRFTLFSNIIKAGGNDDGFYYLIDLHYSQTTYH